MIRVESIAELSTLNERKQFQQRLIDRRRFTSQANHIRLQVRASQAKGVGDHRQRTQGHGHTCPNW